MFWPDRVGYDVWPLCQSWDGFAGNRRERADHSLLLTSNSGSLSVIRVEKLLLSIKPVDPSRPQLRAPMLMIAEAGPQDSLTCGRDAGAAATFSTHHQPSTDLGS